MQVMMSINGFYLVVVLLYSAALSCSSSSSSSDESSESPITDATVSSDEDGIITATIDGNSTTSQKLSASADSTISTSSVVFPVGALLIDTQITIQEGGTVASADTIENIGLSDSTSIHQTGLAVSISSSTATDAVVPFTLNIPAPTVSGLALAEGNLVVFFSVTRDSSHYKGVLPTADLTLDNELVSFDTKYFGVYQAAYISTEVSEEKTVQSTTPIGVKTILEGSWKVDCIQEGTDGSYDMIFTFAGNQLTRTTNLYTALDCTTSSIKRVTNSVGTITIGEESSVASGVYNIDLNSNTVTMTQKTAEATTNANTSEKCGKTDWVINVAKDITNLICDDRVQGQASYSIFKITEGDPDTVTFGSEDNTNDGSTAAKRHISLGSRNWKKR